MIEQQKIIKACARECDETNYKKKNMVQEKNQNMTHRHFDTVMVSIGRSLARRYA